MNRYERGKQKARDLAAEWITVDFPARAWSWGELAEICAYFEKLARRYGLTEEFRENGII